MNTRTFIAGATLALVLALPAAAENHAAHGPASHSSTQTVAPKGDQGASSKAFADANAKMHADMDIPFTGNADVDFARGMIAHHQGAIDMARIELEFGTDPAMRELAEAVIAAQESESAFMKAWLEKNAK